MIVTYNDNTQYYVIYIRQGEASDYVFRPTDPSTGTFVSDTRPLAAKFSPYNLTNKDLTDAEAWHATAIRGGVFVDYPTQAGAFFQWANVSAGHPRRAYHPVNPVGTPTGWSSSTPSPSTHWTSANPALGDTIETCPAGYRRFTIGDTDTKVEQTAVAATELQQSLFFRTAKTLAYPANSSSYRYAGYYADGYFDRWCHEHLALGEDGRADAAVKRTSAVVGCWGVICTNPYTRASVFLPAAGGRGVASASGKLTLFGGQARYWGASTSSTGQAYNLVMNGSSAWVSDAPRYFALNVRCVLQ